MRGARRIAIGASCALLALATIPARAGSSAAQVPVPWELVRDRQASINTLHSALDCTTGNTGLDCAQRDTEVEPSIGVNPKDPRNAVAVFQSSRVDSGGAAGIGFAATLDAGRTWTHGFLPGISTATGGPSDKVSDPVVAFGPDGTVYANALLLGGGRGMLSLNVSRDGGITWEEPNLFADANIPTTDKNWITVDQGTGDGHHTGRIYTVWDYVAPVVYAYSDDEGETWTLGQTGGPLWPGQGIGVLPLVLPSGDLGVVFTTEAYVPSPSDVAGPSDVAATKVVIAIAPGAGRIPSGAPLVFAPPVPIASEHIRGARGQRAGEGLPSAAVDPSSGALYVVWDDGRFRDTVTDVVLTRSTNGGITWTEPVRVNQSGAHFDNHFTPAVGVGPDGSVQVSYRQRRETAGGPETFSPQVDTFFQISHDGGDTFEAPVKVNAGASDMAFAARSRGGGFLGDYGQVAPTEGMTYVVHTEPVRADPSEKRAFPPAFHHQRAWVAVVGPADAGHGRVGPGHTKRAHVRGSRVLARTGIGDTALPVALLALAAIVVIALRRAEA